MKDRVVLPQISRRRMLASMAGFAVGVTTLDLAAPFYAPSATATKLSPIPGHKLRLGANFSPVECHYMDIDPVETLHGILDLNLDFLRVGAYWNQLEPQPDEMEFGPLDEILEACDQRGVPVILTIGIKAPVWPEFHLPAWVHQSVWLPPTGLLTRSERLRELGHRFVRRVAEQYADASVISVLQVENEPFEPIVPEHIWSLDEPFLRRQVTEVRSADRLDRPILLTTYVGSSRLVAGLQAMLRRPTGKVLLDPVFGARPDAALLEMADIVGLDIYPGIGWDLLGTPIYFRPSGPDDYAPLLVYRDAVLAAGKQVMIAECQAKPWEPGDKVTKGISTPSFAPDDTPHLVAKLATFGFDRIALWGLEHWYWHKRFGDPAWWEVGSRLLERRVLPADSDRF